MLVRLVGVRFSSLVGGSQQLDLFNDDAEMTSLYGAIDGIRKKFGENSILKARCI